MLCGSPTFIPFLFTLIRVWHLDNKVLSAPGDDSLFEGIRRVIKEMFARTQNQNKQSSNVLQCKKYVLLHSAARKLTLACTGKPVQLSVRVTLQLLRLRLFTKEK